jgi:hypothetical protein
MESKHWTKFTLLSSGINGILTLDQIYISNSWNKWNPNIGPNLHK